MCLRVYLSVIANNACLLLSAVMPYNPFHMCMCVCGCVLLLFVCLPAYLSASIYFILFSLFLLLFLCVCRCVCGHQCVSNCAGAMHMQRYNCVLYMYIILSCLAFYFLLTTTKRFC